MTVYKCHICEFETDRKWGVSLNAGYNGDDNLENHYKQQHPDAPNPVDKVEKAELSELAAAEKWVDWSRHPRTTTDWEWVCKICGEHGTPGAESGISHFRRLHPDYLILGVM